MYGHSRGVCQINQWFPEDLQLGWLENQWVKLVFADLA